MTDDQKQAQSLMRDVLVVREDVAALEKRLASLSEVSKNLYMKLDKVLDGETTSINMQ